MTGLKPHALARFRVEESVAGMRSNFRQAKPFDLLSELGKFVTKHGIPLDDPKTIPEFKGFVGKALGDALSDRALLHGQRVEAMFEALLISLGQYSLLKAEDNGTVHPRDHYIAPDFRVVLPDGNQWLIEVKNAYVKEPFEQTRRFMDKAYREKLENYAAATGGQLKLAVYWATWGMWTLVSPERFVDEQGYVSIDMDSSFMENELGFLGDRMISTNSPLKLRLNAAPDTVGPVGPDGTVNFSFAGTSIYSGEVELLDPVEKEIARAFMMYGEWTVTEPIPVMDDDMLLAVEFRWAPDKNLNDSLPIIGYFSRMFSRYYSEHTMDNEDVVQLFAPPQPDWFEPLLADDYKGKDLLLRQFKIQPQHLSTDLLKGNCSELVG